MEKNSSGHKQRKNKIWTFHPFLFALAPVLSLYAHNIQKMFMSEIWLPCAVGLAFSVLLFLCFFVIFRNYIKVGVLSSVTLLLFFSYGHIRNFMLAHLDRMQPFTDRILFLSMGLLIIGGVIWLYRTKKPLVMTTKVLNGIAVVMMVLPLVTIISFRSAHTGTVKQQNMQFSGMTKVASAVPGKKLPSIFYIIPDGYCRPDILQNEYGVDQSGLIAVLQKHGFFINEQAHSNYGQTKFSLTSTLHMQYLEELQVKYGIEQLQDKHLRSMLQNNAVFSVLKQQGYKIISYATEYSFSNDIPVDEQKRPDVALTEFQSILVQTTPVGAVMEKFYGGEAGLQRKRILHVFDTLPDIAQADEPCFVFAHIMAPHQPFVFGSNGEPVPLSMEWFYIEDPSARAKAFMQGYCPQATFVAKQLGLLVENILAATSGNAVIIIQADHGLHRLAIDVEEDDAHTARKRLANLHAIYLPDEYKAAFYQGMTPVNQFRMIFAALFNAQLPVLPDKMFLLTEDRVPYTFNDVTEVIEDQATQ